MDTLLQIGLSNSLLATPLAILVAALGRVCRRPALIHGLWLLVLLKLLTPSFIVWPIAWPDGLKPAAKVLPTPASREAPILDTADDATVDLPVERLPPSAASRLGHEVETLPKVDEPETCVSADVDPSSPASAPDFARLWSPVIAGFWLAGSISWFGFAAFRIHRFRSLWLSARPASAQLVEHVERLAERLGLAASPSVWLLPGRLSPMVWALGSRPRLLVSSALWERLTPEQQTTLLVHELAHLRRGDHWVRGLELLVSGLYWWHPVVWWACRELREAEEQCCDAWVIWTLPPSARAYATALLETIDFLSETENALPAVASGIGQAHDLRRRLTMIMHGTTPRALSGVGLLVVLGLGAMLLPLRPTWAQAEDPKARRPVPMADEQLPVVAQAQAQEEDARPQETRSREELRRREDERQRFMAERQRLAQEVERMKANLDRAMAELKRAETRLAELQERERTASRLAAQAMSAEPGQPAPRGRRPAREQASDPEQRLADLEKRLDDLLSEVQSLRREMRRSAPGMIPSPARPGAAPGMPGAQPPGGRPMMRGPAGAPPALALPPSPAQPAAPEVPLAPPAPRADPPAPPQPEVPSQIQF